MEVVRQFSAEHLANGHRVELATLDAPDAPFLSELSMTVHALGSNSTGYGYAPTLIGWLQANATRFDVVIVHGLWQYHGLGTWKTLRGTATPYFVYPHGMLDPWFRHAYPLKHLKKALYWRWAEHKLLRDARAVLFTCEEERLLARNTFCPYRCAERIAPLGIQAPSGNAAEQREAFLTANPDLRDKRILLFLGRLHKKKGCDLLIRAFAQIAAQEPLGERPPRHLVLAGPCADPVYLKSLQDLAAKEVSTMHSSHGVPSISFLSMVTGDLKWGAFHAADAFVLPSHQENFGIAVAEALACGTPVLISNKVNIWREIEEDGAGLVAPDDLEGTQRLLSNWEALSSEQQIGMRENAKRCFEKRFEIREAARHLTRLLETADQ